MDLEQHLKDLCEQHNPRLDLYERLVRVRNSAEAIWPVQHLNWFTDHKATTHSRNIIEHLGSVLEHLQATSQSLNAQELYVLLAACYLHDIGMQYFRSEDDRGREQFVEEDYIRIRKEHPSRGRALIINRTLERERDSFRIDLDDDPQYVVPIGLVSEAHGSDFFIDKVRELQERGDRPGNRPFRGDLLAALLLMGDELDLHESRATFPQEFAYSPVSLLHHHIHHYVTGVEIDDGHTPKHRRVRLTMEFPEDSDEYREDVRAWITTKLRKQAELTNPVIEQATQGELLWDNQIEIVGANRKDRYGVRRSLLASRQTEKALEELRREVIAAQTVNRDELTKAVRDSVNESRRHFQAIQVIDQEKSDWSHLAKRFTASCNCDSITLISVGFLDRTGHDPLGVLQIIADGLSEAQSACSNYTASQSSIQQATGHDALSLLGDALLADVQAWTENAPLVVLLQRIDRAESDTLRWLVEWLLPELSKQDVKLLLIFTQFENEGVEEMSALARVFRLTSFTQSQIAEHLQATYGFTSENAERKASYIISNSSGIPEFVHNGFAIERRQGIILSA